MAGAEDRSTPNATNTKPKECQTTMTVSVPPDSNKQKEESHNKSSSQTPGEISIAFEGNKKQQ